MGRKKRWRRSKKSHSFCIKSWQVFWFELKRKWRGSGFEPLALLPVGYLFVMCCKCVYIPKRESNEKMDFVICAVYFVSICVWVYLSISCQPYNVAQWSLMNLLNNFHHACFADDYEKEIRKRERWERHRRNITGRQGGDKREHRRQKRSISIEKHVETLVVIDPIMVKYYANSDLETYVLTIINMVSNFCLMLTLQINWMVVISYWCHINLVMEIIM